MNLAPPCASYMQDKDLSLMHVHLLLSKFGTCSMCLNLLFIPIKHMDEITNVQVDKICNHTLNWCKVNKIFYDRSASLTDFHVVVVLFCIGISYYFMGLLFPSYTSSSLKWLGTAFCIIIHLIDWLAATVVIWMQCFPKFQLKEEKKMSLDHKPWYSFNSH